MNKLRLFTLLIFLALGFVAQSQQNLNLSAPDIQPNPLQSALSGGTGCYSFVVQNVNGAFATSCGARITILMSDIEPIDSERSVSSNVSPSAWNWSLNASGELIGDQIGSIGFLYSETITVCFNVTNDSVEPGSNGFTAMVETGVCDDGNSTDNVAASTTWTDAPLPIELLDFKAKKQERNVLLQWTTLHEINNDYFDLQRSFDGMAFETIGKVDGAGTSVKERSYSFNDQSVISLAEVRAIPQIYYRLEQFDLDGKSEFSPVRSVAIDLDTENHKMLIFPNPASEYVQISFSGTTQYILNVYDELGQLLETMELDGGQKVHTKNWQPGTYVFEIFDKSNGELIQQERVIIIK
jgi:hypothetical protein